LEGSDFFSGNYLTGGIEGTTEKNLYIATQGPLESTIPDFWRVIWEHNVSVIAMLAKEWEGNKEKVFRYWPDQLNLPQQLGDFWITMEEVNLVGHHGVEEMIVRRFSLECPMVSFFLVLIQFNIHF
jgi:protein tyrosine phosphatase